MTVKSMIKALGGVKEAAKKMGVSEKIMRDIYNGGTINFLDAMILSEACHKLGVHK